MTRRPCLMQAVLRKGERKWNFLARRARHTIKMSYILASDRNAVASNTISPSQAFASTLCNVDTLRTFVFRAGSRSAERIRGLVE